LQVSRIGIGTLNSSTGVLLECDGQVGVPLYRGIYDSLAFKMSLCNDHCPNHSDDKQAEAYNRDINPEVCPDTASKFHKLSHRFLFLSGAVTASAERPAFQLFRIPVLAIELRIRGGSELRTGS
jgi:hypothetical protein